MTDFFYIDDIGQLKIDKVFFEYVSPVLFTCSNDKNELFICVCCVNNKKGKIWLLSKTSPSSVLELLKNKITIRDAFLENKDLKISIVQTKNKTKIQYGNKKYWSLNNNFLPKEGEYIDSEEHEFDEEIEYYESLLVSSYSDYNYDTVISSQKTEINDICEYIDPTEFEGIFNSIIKEYVIKKDITEYIKDYFLQNYIEKYSKVLEEISCFVENDSSKLNESKQIDEEQQNLDYLIFAA